MQISPITNIYHYSVQKVNKPTFKAHYDRGQIDENVGDGVRYRHGFIHNYSYLLRDAQLFLEMPQLLTEKFPDGVKIFDYGCSIGYEPVSIALGLHNNLPEDKVKNYTPIYARDNNAQIIKNAQDYKLRFDEYEMEKLSLLKNINTDDYFVKTRTDKLGQKIHNIKDSLKKEIIFEKADLYDDLDSDKLSDEPCVVLLRNAWQFMTEEGRDELAEKLHEKLKPKSVVFIGSYDVSANADESLLKAGFKRIEGNYSMKKGNKDSQFDYTNYMNYKINDTNKTAI